VFRASFLFFALTLAGCDALYDVESPSGHLVDAGVAADAADAASAATGDATSDAIADSTSDDAAESGEPLLPGVWALPPVGISGLFFADANGDGRADLIALEASTIRVWLSDGTRFVPSDTPWAQATLAADWTWFADVTGDGKADGIEVMNSGFNGISVLPSSGSSFGGATAWSSGQAGGGSPIPIENPFAFADVTGDGKADAIEFDYAGIYVLPSTGRAFAQPANWTNHTWAGDYCTAVADVTGDAKADALLCGSPSYTGIDAFIYEATSTETAFDLRSQDGGSQSLQVGEPWTTVAFWGHIATYFADLNGDKKADVIAVEENVIYVLLSTGTGFRPVTAPEDTWLKGDFGQMSASAVADVNGDGMADFIAVELDGVHVWLSDGSIFVVPSGANGQ
jgi:FG-GAP-like repeat